jgi:multiple sugar transport system permease protein
MATRLRRFTLSDQAVGVLFMVPFVLTALFFMVYPIVEAVRMAFFSYNPLRPDLSAFVGLSNFSYIFDDQLFWTSFWQATVWTGFSIVFQTLFGVAIALLLHQALPGIAIFRGLLLFPLLASGVISERIYWLSTPEMAMASTIMLNVWKYTPFVVICVLARLQSVPLELYDAAKVDGAGVIRRFADVTLPQLKEVLIVVVVFRTIWTFNKFEEIYLLTKGGPGTSTFNLAVYAFEQSIANLKLGVGAATGVIMMIMLSAGSVIYLRSAGFAREEGHG